MNKFTAGPWIIDDFDISSKADPANLIASLYAVEKDDRGGYYLGDEFKANARLIASAPDLLAALEALLGKAYKQNFNDSYPEILDACETAIAKARGDA